MKNQLILAAAVVSLSVASASQAAYVFSEPFDNYSNAVLVGQGGWTTTGTTVTNPLTVQGGTDKDVALITSGQDAFKAFATSVPHTDGNAIYTGVNINLSAAQATGDYFSHLMDPAASTTTAFYQRLFAKSSGAGFVLGIVATSGTGATITYGTPVLSFGSDYRVVVAWNFVAGATNDTFSVYVNPTSTVEGSNTPYVTYTWDSVTGEPLQLTAANLRQGTAANAATLTVDDYTVTTDFATAVPEPTTLGLLAGMGVIALRRRSAR